MAHNIDMSNGRANAVYIGAGPWHGLGTVISNGTDLTPAQFLELSGTNWQVKETPVMYTTEFGVFTDDSRVLYRSDNGGKLHIASPTYQIHQHTEVWDTMQTVCEIGGEYGIDFKPASAFALAGGKRVVYVLRLNNNLIDVQGDKFLPYFFGTTSHDESWATTFQLSGFRLECENMTRMALARETPRFKIKHTANSNGRIQSIREALGLMPQYIDDFMLEIQQLQDITVTTGEREQFVQAVFPIEEKREAKRQSPNVRRRDEVLSTIANDMRIGEYRDTAWGLFQGVSTWEQHVRGDKTGEARQLDIADKFLSDGLTFSNRAAEILSDKYLIAA